MELVIMSFLAFIALLFNELKLIAQLISTPSGTTYLGTTHSPADYFYYLSQFSQGKSSFLWGQDFFTGDFLHPTLIGWTNTLTGRLFSRLGFGPIPAYHMSLIFELIILFVLAYVFIRILFPASATKRCVSFFLYLFANAFPQISYSAHGLSLNYYDFWFNKGVPFVRFGQVPHQILVQISIIIICIASIMWGKHPRTKHAFVWLFLASISGLILASTNTIQWAFVLSVIPLSYMIAFLFQRKTKTIKQLFISFAPTLGAGFCGLPMALYIQSVTHIAPYSQLVFWEKTNQNLVSFRQFILGYGPILPLALIGVFILIKKRITMPVFIILYPLLSIIFFFSPLPSLLGFMNDRFMSQTVSLFLAILATITITSLHTQKNRYLIPVIIIGLIIAISIPTYTAQIKEQTKVDTQDAFVYIPNGVQTLYKSAEKTGTSTDVFLVQWPFNVSFPAVAGRHGFFGHPLLTIENKKKDDIHNEFFYTKLSKETVRKLITENHISYVIGYEYVENLKYPMFEMITGTGSLGLYKVRN